MLKLSANVLLFVACSVLQSALLFAQKDCSLPPSGLSPITDLENKLYRGFKGGLYPEATNQKPLKHRSALQDALKKIFPRGNDGSPSSTGTIVMIGVGASNPRTEFNRLMQIVDTSSQVHSSVKLVNTCIGGQGIQKMNNVDDNYWKQAQKTLDSLGLGAKQVQVLWVETDNTQTADTVFPRAPQTLMNDFKTLFITAKELFPNLSIIYCTARTYTGFIKQAEASAGRGLLHPRDYYNGWAIKWMIENQYNGNPDWTTTPNGSTMPIITWATYNWTDGNTPRNDGTTWDCQTHFGNDGLHLTELGEWKSGIELYSFFSKDSIASQWFTKHTTVNDSPSAIEDNQVAPLRSIHCNSAIPYVVVNPIEIGKLTQIKVSTLYGSTIYEESITQNTMIPTDTWASGLYILSNGMKTQLILKDR